MSDKEELAPEYVMKHLKYFMQDFQTPMFLSVFRSIRFNLPHVPIKLVTIIAKEAVANYIDKLDKIIDDNKES